jgi:hypothetical protein
MHTYVSPSTLQIRPVEGFANETVQVCEGLRIYTARPIRQDNTSKSVDTIRGHTTSRMTNTWETQESILYGCEVRLRREYADVSRRV